MSGCRIQTSNKGNDVAILLRPACKAQQSSIRMSVEQNNKNDKTPIGEISQNEYKITLDGRKNLRIVRN